MNNTAVAGISSGAFLNSLGAGTNVTVLDAIVANNTCQGRDGSGGALFFKSGMSSLWVGNTTFSGNTAARCGAVDIRSARQIQMVGTTFDGNTASRGDGGGLVRSRSQSTHDPSQAPPFDDPSACSCAGGNKRACRPPLFFTLLPAQCIALLPPETTLATCVSDQVLKQFEPAGHLAAIPISQAAPNVDMLCTWDLYPPLGCTVQLDVLLMSLLPPLTATLRVIDRDTGAALYLDNSTTGELPPPVQSTGNGGLRVSVARDACPPKGPEEYVVQPLCCTSHPHCPRPTHPTLTRRSSTPHSTA